MYVLKEVRNRFFNDWIDVNKYKTVVIESLQEVLKAVEPIKMKTVFKSSLNFCIEAEKEISIAEESTKLLKVISFDLSSSWGWKNI